MASTPYITLVYMKAGKVTMNRYTRLQRVAVLGALLVGIGAVVRENMPAEAGAHTPVSSPVRAASAQILVNAQGMTLYLFTSDKKNQSTCTGQCATYWPPVLLPSGTQAPSAIPGING